MIEPDFLARACAEETLIEQRALYYEIFDEVAKERDDCGLPPNRIQVAAEAGRRMRQEVKKANK